MEEREREKGKMVWDVNAKNGERRSSMGLDVEVEGRNGYVRIT